MRAGVVDSTGVPTRSARAALPAQLTRLHASLDPARTALEAARILLEVAGASSCGVWAPGGGTSLGGATQEGAAPGFDRRVAPPSPSLAQVSATLGPVLSREPADEALTPGGRGPTLLVPLATDGEVIAIAAVEWGGASFGPDVISEIEDIAGSAATALANAEAYAAARQRVERLSLRREVDESERGAALARERDRIAAGLHDTAGQLFVAIRVLARREAGQLSPASEAAARLHRLADLADQGKWEIDHAIDALALFPAARHGLAPALRSLGSSFHEDDLDVIVDVYGHAVRLPARVERALYRVVHESLANARHSRCSVVRVALTFDDAGVHLEVADDGTGLTRTIPDRGRPGTGELRRTVAEAGGLFLIRNAQPRGIVIEAAIPKEGP